ncbi:MAG: hypothetical protein GPJ54_06285 [Candidatus Heimdallarchaeota archaeon]|nr:hypothetical protein [Candidatus Heimdallarchaeota archaeon]
MGFSLAEFFFLSVGIVSLFPTFVLLRQYRYSRIRDYLFFSFAFFFNSVMQFTFYLIESDAKLIYLQIAYGSQVIFYFLFYLHGSQIEWIRPPKPITIIGWGWALSILILITFWSKLTFEPTETVFFVSMPRSFTSFYPNGAGISIKGHFIHGTSYRVFSDLFRIFVMLLILRAYIRVVPVNETSRIKFAKQLWIIASSLHLIYLFSILPWGITNQWPGILNMISSLLILVIIVFIPEAALISKVQLLRANKLYNKLAYTKLAEKASEVKFGADSIFNYLENLPSDVKEMLNLNK